MYLLLYNVYNRLIDHPVIRLKLANMARLIESSWSMLESVTYQMSTLSKKDQNEVLSGPIALLVCNIYTVL